MRLGRSLAQEITSHPVPVPCTRITALRTFSRLTAHLLRVSKGMPRVLRTSAGLNRFKVSFDSVLELMMESAGRASAYNTLLPILVLLLSSCATQDCLK